MNTDIDTQNNPISSAIDRHLNILTENLWIYL